MKCTAPLRVDLHHWHTPAESTIPDALNRTENHAAIEAALRYKHSAGGKGRTFLM